MNDDLDEKGNLMGGTFGRSWARSFTDAKQVIERFAMPITESGCWVWEGSTSNGYGRIHHEGRQQYAHRLVFELTNGPIPAGMVICHRCDVRECINPAHMFLGTAADNRADCVSKRRQAKGSRMAQAKLSESQAAEIRRDTRLQLDIAEDYEVSVSTVSLIQLGKSWRHAV